MAGSLSDLQKLLIRASKEIPDKALRVIGVEGKKFIEKNFRDQSFTDTTSEKWKDRKTTDKNGLDSTRYRTNRVGRSGSLNRYGSRIADRAILVGFNTGGDKLKNSFKYSVSKGSNTVVFRTYKPYAKRHNEGLDGMSKRKFIGKSEYLNRQIADKIKRELDLTLR
ncbi:phage morphogenesis protein [Flavobacterium branchiarum]|uniref:Phage morphogenesis protein n=1 Tax=Flavobacterium branchiarum TaxID=1114870 RepID=A0ABV5FPU7_9FLAO|nr:phage morphogenesis protein [Flavobacterium branchiarum]MDN3673091.1 phage morphogenesis protein [Flavobacterium branchiarum]